MKTLDEATLDKLAHHSGDPWKPEHRYFAHAEKHMQHSWDKLIWPFIHDCDFTSVIDLAAGHGRNSEMLKQVAKQILILDIQPENVELCRQRFKGDDRFEFAVCNGYDLQPARDNAYTLVYCVDAMVHFDSDVVRSYLADVRRVLAPGGMAFFHHSNHTEGTLDWVRNPGSRNFMSKDLFRHYAVKEELAVVRQQIIDWSKLPGLDCLTLVRKDG
jgi:ubiquinone/menaquinone biosynthesis C-methylase UbiE